MVVLSLAVVVLTGFLIHAQVRGRKAPAPQPHARERPVDDEKVFRLGIQRQPGLCYTIKDGLVWSLAPDSSRPRPLTSTPFLTNVKFLYYLDQDGDVSRRRKTS